MADILSQEEVDRFLGSDQEGYAESHSVQDGLPNGAVSLKAEVIRTRIMLRMLSELRDEMYDVLANVDRILALSDQVLINEEISEFFKRSITRMGIGRCLSRRLQDGGCRTVCDLCGLTKSILESRFGFNEQEITKVEKALEKMGLYLVG